MPSDDSTTDQSGERASTTTSDQPGDDVGHDATTDATSDETTDGTPVPDGRREGEPPGSADAENRAGRDVVVPMRVYKAVTVFSTLFAVGTVVGGFVLLDTATNRARADLDEIQPALALLGVGLIVAGAAAYAFSTRFRAAGMGKSKDDTDESSDNG